MLVLSVVVHVLFFLIKWGLEKRETELQTRSEAMPQDSSELMKVKMVQVQKGDPQSKLMEKYRPGSEFLKTRTTGIGAGSRGLKSKAAAREGGVGDTYRGLDFTMKSNSATALQGERFKIKTAADDLGAGQGLSAGIGDGQGHGAGDGRVTGSRQGTLEKAKVLTNVGNLAGTVEGVVGVGKGAEGLSQKNQLIIAGEPDETIVLGSLDPAVVRLILIDHMPQFRACYQREIERSPTTKLSGVVVMDFTIGASGRVTQAAVGGASELVPSVRDCLSGVVKSLRFPKPKGGGIVEVTQPMNFYPKRNL